MAVGDVSMGWEVGRKIKNQGVGAPWTGVKRYFDEADLVVANLECVVSNVGQPWPRKRIHLRAPPLAADSLVAGGIDVVSVANNHALDYGPVGFTDELRRLDERGIRYVGGGMNRAAARQASVVEENGLRIAFLGYVMPMSGKYNFNTRDWEATATRAGLAIGTPENIGPDIRRARESADLVVVMIHGGYEYRAKPTAAQRRFANAALDAGASLVLGHHPHVLQGYAKRGDRLIAFSLGNFIFARFNGRPNDSAILDVTLTPDGVASIDWIPVVIRKDGIPRPATAAEARRIRGRLPAL